MSEVKSHEVRIRKSQFGTEEVGNLKSEVTGSKSEERGTSEVIIWTLKAILLWISFMSLKWHFREILWP